jgi:hypothetical protein
MGQDHAIFTGDLIRSTRTAPERIEATMALLSDTAGRIAALTGTDTRFTRFRGDGWQMHVAPVRHVWLALVLTLATLRASPRALETRVSIGIGPVDTLGSGDLSDGHGAAFTISGHALDGLGRPGRIAGTGDDPPGVSQSRRVVLAGAARPHHQVLAEYIAHLSTKWTRAQAEAVALALREPSATQGHLATVLGISRQALNARLKAAGYAPLQMTIFAANQEAGEGAAGPAPRDTA